MHHCVNPCCCCRPWKHKSVKKNSKIFWVLLWWNGCGKVAVEHCIICIQLKNWSWIVIFFVFNKFYSGRLFVVCWLNLCGPDSFFLRLSGCYDRQVGHLVWSLFASKGQKLNCFMFDKVLILILMFLSCDWNHLTSSTSCGGNLKV